MQSALPPFDPSLVEARIHVTMKETIRTGQYESIDVMIHLETERDPRFSLRENCDMLRELALFEVAETARVVRSQIQVEK